MGQKVNPHGLRVGVIKGWDSRWYAPNDKVGALLLEDYKIREYLKTTLQSAGVPRVEIERDSARVRVFLHCARPGIVIGRQGQDIEKLRAKLEGMIKKPVALNIVEVRSPDMNAQLVAENIAQQLEKRISFRRAMKQAMQRSMRLGARGIKTCVAGRLGGAEIARVEHYHEGTIPLQTLRADIDYGFAEAKTTYGRLGVKVWIYKGEVLSVGNRMGSRTIEAPRPRDDRRDRRDRGPRPGGDRRDRGPRGGGGFGGGRPGGGPRPGGFGGQGGGPRPGGFGGQGGGPRPGGFGGQGGGPRPGGFGGQGGGPRPGTPPREGGPR
ncbi:MAG: 30S ribosomal protein S3 [Oscillospiraceae bacterium]|jgi:small subunit ribosomal protein S3|nr:30S ribosomal protein S3 [Oscillospiraceae bacterium]